MVTTSVEAICFNYRPKKDNTYPIMLRLTKSGKRKYVSLGVSVKKKKIGISARISQGAIVLIGISIHKKEIYKELVYWHRESLLVNGDIRLLIISKALEVLRTLLPDFKNDSSSIPKEINDIFEAYGRDINWIRHAVGLKCHTYSNE